MLFPLCDSYVLLQPLIISLSLFLSIHLFLHFSVYPPRPSRSVSFASCRSPFSPYRQESMIRTDLFNRFRRFLPFHPLHSVTFLLSSFFLPLLSLSLSLSLFHSLPPSLSLSFLPALSIRAPIEFLRLKCGHTNLMALSNRDALDPV